MTNKNQNIPADSMYYVYVLIDPRNDQPFYVGKGRGKRVTSHYKQCILEKDSNPFKKGRIKKLTALGFDPYWKILFETLDEAEAYKTESYYIKLWGRKYAEEKGILLNIAPGFENKKARSNSIRAQIRPVDQYDTSGKFIQTFPSMLAAARHLNKSQTQNIFLCCTKVFKKAYGYFWTFGNETLDLEWHSRPNKKSGPKTSKAVYQWDHAGNLIATHTSAFQAAKSLNNIKRESDIYNSIQGGWLGLGYRWTYTPNSPGLYVDTKKIIKIYQWSMSGEFVAAHTSSRKAIEYINLKHGLNIKPRHSDDIRQSIKRKGTFQNYQWTDKNVSPGVRKTRGCRRLVNKYSLDGELIACFESCIEAARSCGRAYSELIISCCKNKLKTSYGFKWAYAEDELDLDWCFGGKKKPVYQWDLEGNFVNKFISVSQAAIKIQKPSCSAEIRKSAKTLRTICQGFRWTFDNKSPGKFIKQPHPKRQVVYQFTIEGKFIKKHASFYEANIFLNKKSNNEISKAIRKKNGIAFGFKWSLSY